MKKINALLIAAMLFSILSCKKSAPEGPAGPPGHIGPTGYYGKITGHVTLYDENGIQITHGLDNVAITLSDGHTTMADVTGRYQFDSVASGNYRLSASCDSFGATQSKTFAFLKDSVTQNLKLTHKPELQLQKITISRVASPASDRILPVFSGFLRQPWVLFVSKSPQVSNTNYLLCYVSGLNGTGPNVITLTVDDYMSAGIFYGETVYYAAYSYVRSDYSAYDDYTSGAKIYTAIGTPILDTMTAP